MTMRRIWWVDRGTRTAQDLGPATGITLRSLWWDFAHEFRYRARRVGADHWTVTEVGGEPVGDVLIRAQADEEDPNAGTA